MLTPTLVILAIVGFLPFIYVLVIGFFDWNAFSNQLGMQWAGVNNYRPLAFDDVCLLYTTPSPRDRTRSRMPSSALKKNKQKKTKKAH